MDELKKQVESLLFSAGRKLTIEEISKLVKERDHAKITSVLEQLRGEYEGHSGSLMVVQDGNAWKITVREAYLPTVRKIVTQTELPKSVMETLAVIAYKAPVLQSTIIKIRTNKGYDHLGLLEADGFITRVKHSRTKLIRLSPKFFDYFDIPEAQLKQKFANVAALESAIKEKEGEIEARETEIEQKQKAIKAQDDAHRKHTESEHKRLDAELAKMPEIDLIDDEGEAHKLKTYPTTPIPDSKPDLSPKIEVVKEAGFETYGEDEKPAPATGEVPVEVFEKPQPKPIIPMTITEPEVVDIVAQAREEVKAEQEREKQETDESLPAVEPLPRTAEEEMEDNATDIASGKKQSREFKGEGMFSKGVSPKVAKRIDERVEEIVHGAKKDDTPTHSHTGETDDEDADDDDKEGEEE